MAICVSNRFVSGIGKCVASGKYCLQLVLMLVLSTAISTAWAQSSRLDDAANQPKVRVVATFSILGDLVKAIGGDRVELTTIVGPNADAHTFEPKPADVKALAHAQILVLNGLDFEAWLPRLIESSGFQGQQLLASQGVVVRHLSPKEALAHAHHTFPHDHDHDQVDEHAGHEHTHPVSDVDPHAWQNLQNGMIYAQNIMDGLILADPDHSRYFETRGKALIQKMSQLDQEIKQAFMGIPVNKRRVVSAHDAFGYFSQAYGIEFIAVAGLSNQAEVSAKEMARIVNTVKKEEIAGVFVEGTANPNLAKQIAKETGAAVGGALYADALAEPGHPADSYLGMMSWNAGQLIYVLKGEPKKDGD